MLWGRLSSFPRPQSPDRSRRSLGCRARARRPRTWCLVRGRRRGRSAGWMHMFARTPPRLETRPRYDAEHHSAYSVNDITRRALRRSGPGEDLTLFSRRAWTVRIDLGRFAEVRRSRGALSRYGQTERETRTLRRSDCHRRETAVAGRQEVFVRLGRAHALASDILPAWSPPHLGSMFFRIERRSSRPRPR